MPVSFFEVSMTGAGKDQLMDALSGFFTDGNNAPFISDFPDVPVHG